ncbi:MAG: hypothetical protein A2898_04190 [Candidatus Kerfeldbacteria bacterium RIFCSPLOWO2_01_FULL_48_11]|uniref:Uncharacterized protein n=2 Tax=Parcubacteria group TaxID=1794811 RepID=A0A1G1Y7N6_9BACT|nr:MAG: Polysaccharide biosynthesis protein [Parcubacteria group bacterium GW2011_GWA2_48_9]KKW16322.1 MAG: Polysaccharide biosynthesis protein [Parcubacteria group bacterium GW2011_GWC2_49_9]OGY48241.1 MAG: hypothetical protein A2840_00570 [Candidatus Buchananbacteria bacterium RIFCSPHIGHO2_01_FULL_47_11b]OGY82767.1 MAG: hypothetical protein A2898_04190 [Candidatus Kerfeldbacteria bacterium RIFCSPLOWO2_01_FULL_48_11]HCJ52179.1 hypothetical protein [Candidatus Kerfeldbacteria bacterium]
MDTASLQTELRSDSQERILKNTSFLTVAFVIQKAISLLYFVFIARRIGPVNLGLYDPLKSLIPIALILIDFSLSAVLTREIARRPDKIKEYVSNVLGIKVIFGFFVLLIAGLITIFGPFSTETRTLLYFVGMIVVLDTFTLTFFAVFRGLQNLRYESLAIIINQLLTISAGGAALLKGYGLQGLFTATLIGSFFNFVFSLWVIKKKVHFFPLPTWDPRIITVFLKIAVPFALAAMLVKVFTYTDRYMILALAGKQYVGWYVTAHKLTFALEFIPSAFAASVYPAMSTFFVSSHEQLKRTFEKTMYYLMIIAVPLAVAIFTLADRLIPQLYTSTYSAAIVPLRIMIIGLICVFMNFPVGALLNACNMQKQNTINMAIIVACNIVLNSILIPRFTFIGAAVSTLISTTLLFFLGLRWAKKIIRFDGKYLLVTLGKSFTAAVVMAVFIYIVAPLIKFDVAPYFGGAGTYIQIMIYYGMLAIAGAIVYFYVLSRIKGVVLMDLKSLVTTFRRKTS